MVRRLRPPAPPAGSAAPLLVIPPTRGLDSRAQLPLWGLAPRTGQLGPPPRRPPKPCAHEKGVRRRLESVSLGTSECQTPGLTSSPPVLALCPVGTTQCREPTEAPQKAENGLGGGEPQPQALAKGNSIGSALVWAARHLHKDLLQPGPAGAGGTQHPQARHAWQPSAEVG